MMPSPQHVWWTRPMNYDLARLAGWVHVVTDHQHNWRDETWWKWPSLCIACGWIQIKIIIIIITVLTVVFVEDAVDDRVTAAGDEDKNLRHSVGVDERSLDAVSRPASTWRWISFVHDQRNHLNKVTYKLR